MGFASDAPVGQGLGQHRGPQPVTLALGHRHAPVAPGASPPLFGVPVLLASPQKAADHPAEGKEPNARGFWPWRRGPQPVRHSIPDAMESRHYRDGPLAGSPFHPATDPEGWGILTEPAQMRLDPDKGVQPVSNGSPEGTWDDITTQIQAGPSEEFLTLRALRTSFPHIQVVPAPQCRSCVIDAAGKWYTLVLPDGAVVARFAWSGMRVGVDLLFSFAGGDFAAPAAPNPNNPGEYDGIGLNPLPDAFYYVKSRNSISFMVPATSLQSAFPCIVNAQCYVNN